MHRLTRLLVIFFATHVLIFASPAFAAEPTNSGLLISPPRHTVRVDAGGSDSQKITIANYTKQPLDVVMSVQEFSVANLSYEYQIQDVAKPWLHLEKTQLHLETGESEELLFSVSPPATTAPGGKYYLIVASATAKNGDLVSTIQVAAPVYITVNGKLDTSSKLERNHGIDQIVILGDVIPFHLDVSNTGNIHYLIEVKASLRGLFTDHSKTSTQHILLPDTTRRINASIPVPLLPGIYQATYGYSSEATGDVSVRAWVLYLPPWAMIALGLLIWIVLMVIRLVKNHHATDSQPPQYTSPT